MPERKMLIRAVVIAAIVGPVLIAINQGAELLAGEGLSYAKAVLTVIVPFTVSLVSSLLMARQNARGLPRLDEIASNAQKVNAAGREQYGAIERVSAAARRLGPSASGLLPQDAQAAIEEILASLDTLKQKTDIAVECSAANVRIAGGG